MAEDFAVTETLYLDADKTRVLKEGDPQAAWLLAVPGDHIPAAEAQRLGLTGKAAAPAEEKAVHGSANKALSPQQDK